MQEQETNDLKPRITVKTVSVTYGRKINLGNYESANLDVTVWADVADDANLDAAMHDLWAMARANVRAQAAQFQKGASINIEETFLGLPVGGADAVKEGEQ